MIDCNMINGSISILKIRWLNTTNHNALYNFIRIAIDSLFKMFFSSQSHTAELDGHQINDFTGLRISNWFKDFDWEAIGSKPKRDQLLLIALGTSFVSTAQQLLTAQCFHLQTILGRLKFLNVLRAQ